MIVFNQKYSLLLLLLACCVKNGESQELARFEQTQFHMGVNVTIAVYCRDLQHAESALQKAFAVFERNNRLFSDYDSSSVINELCATDSTNNPVDVEPDVFELIEAAHKIAIETDGAFDYTLGRLTKLWRVSRKMKELPNAGELKKAVASSGYRHIKLTANSKQIQIDINELRMDFGGIAKGYSCDQALDELQQVGVESALINAGGDIAVSNPPPGKSGWRIALNELENGKTVRHFIVVANCGVATSGDQKKFVEIDGIRYSHIIDPTTGLGLAGHRQVTVIAKNGMLADAYASAFNVMDQNAIETFVKERIKSGLATRVGVMELNENKPTRRFDAGSFPQLHALDNK